jgi:hypothetical protein
MLGDDGRLSHGDRSNSSGRFNIGGSRGSFIGDRYRLRCIGAAAYLPGEKLSRFDFSSINIFGVFGSGSGSSAVACRAVTMSFADFEASTCSSFWGMCYLLLKIYTAVPMLVSFIS